MIKGGTAYYSNSSLVSCVHFGPNAFGEKSWIHFFTSADLVNSRVDGFGSDPKLVSKDSEFKAKKMPGNL